MKKLLLIAIVCVLGLFGTLRAQNTEVVIDGTVGAYAANMNRISLLCSSPAIRLLILKKSVSRSVVSDSLQSHGL